jgi:hypothetical protein
MCIHVPEGRTASIFTVKEKEIENPARNNLHEEWSRSCLMVGCLDLSLTLKMETVPSSSLELDYTASHSTRKNCYFV